MKRWYSRFFPTPKFLAMPAVGIDISDQSVKYIYLERLNGSLRIAAYGRHDIPDGVIEAGLIKKPNDLVFILKKLKTELPTDLVRVALPEEPAYLFATDVPLMKEEEIRESLVLQLEKHVPISPAEAIFDFDIVKIDKDNALVQVAVLNEEIVNSYLEVFHKAGFIPTAFELEPQAIARAVVPFGDRGIHMIVDFGATRTGLSVVDTGHVLFTTTIDVGGNDLVKILVDTYKITPDKAEALKNRYGLKGSKETQKALPAMREKIELLAEAIKTNFNYWHSHSNGSITKDEEIAKVLVCGGNARLIGLMDVMREKMKGTKLELADPWINLYGDSKNAYVPPVKKSESLLFVSALGLALGDHM